MTVSKLIEELQKLPPEVPVIYNGREDEYVEVDFLDVEDWTPIGGETKKAVIIF